MSTLAARSLASLALAVVVAAGVSSCTPTPEPTPTQTAAAPSVSPTPTPTKKPVDEGSPVTLTCDELVAPSVIYAFNPNTVFDEGYERALDTGAAQAVELDGVSCAWINQSSGDLFTVAVAHPSASRLASLEESAGTAAVGWTGTFDGGDESALAQAFVDGYWVVMEFDFFVEQGDVVPIMDAVLESLKS
jgi:hypothetical protein